VRFRLHQAAEHVDGHDHFNFQSETEKCGNGRNAEFTNMYRNVNKPVKRDDVQCMLALQPFI
jgi:hypothetical protein